MKTRKASLIVCAAFLLVCNVKCADDCLYPCNLIHDPVCASDGNEFKFFSNECSMDRHNSCESASKFVTLWVFLTTANPEYSQASKQLMKRTAANLPTTSIFWGKTIFSFHSRNFTPPERLLQINLLPQQFNKLFLFSKEEWENRESNGEKQFHCVPSNFIFRDGASVCSGGGTFEP